MPSPSPRQRLITATNKPTPTLLDRSLQGLPPDQATAVLLVDGDGYSYDEAAAILGVAEGTIASRLNRGRHALRQTLHVHNAEGRHQ